MQSDIGVDGAQMGGHEIPNRTGFRFAERSLTFENFFARIVAGARFTPTIAEIAVQINLHKYFMEYSLTIPEYLLSTSSSRHDKHNKISTEIGVFIRVYHDVDRTPDIRWNRFSSILKNLKSFRISEQLSKAASSKEMFEIF
uniref:Uncharacterized protein n=1 Tax=Romanomermis culicivorax TaxID=13658 RepID=A0A915HQ09_ROMCU